jgi:hypothetical protein
VITPIHPTPTTPPNPPIHPPIHYYLLDSCLAVADVSSLSYEIEASCVSGLERDRADLRDVFASLDRIAESVVPELERDLGTIQSLMDSLEVRVSQFHKQRPSWLKSVWPGLGLSGRDVRERGLDDHARYSYQIAHAQLRTEESLLRRMDVSRMDVKEEARPMGTVCAPPMPVPSVPGPDDRGGGGDDGGGGGACSGVKAVVNTSHTGHTAVTSDNSHTISTAVTSSSASSSPSIIVGAGAIAGAGAGEEDSGADLGMGMGVGTGVGVFVGASVGACVGAGGVRGEGEIRAVVAADTVSGDIVQL